MLIKTITAIHVNQGLLDKTLKEEASFPEDKYKRTAHANKRTGDLSLTSDTCNLHFFHPKTDNRVDGWN